MAEQKDKEQGIDWRLALILLPLPLVGLLIMSAVIVFISGKTSTFAHVFFPFAGIVYGGTAIYVLFIWITKPIRDLSSNAQEKLLELFGAIVARLIVLGVLGFIAWAIYEAITS